VQGDTLVITDTDGVTYSGTVERTGGTFRMETGGDGTTVIVEGRIDNSGAITGSLIATGGGERCDIPITGQRN